MMTFVFKRTYRGPLQAVIFDWAGTTVDYGSRAPAMVFVEVFRRQGVEITFEQARGPMGMAKRDHIKQLTELAPVALRWQAEHGRLPTEADIEAMYEAFIPLQVEALADYAELIPGTLACVADCRRRGIAIGANTGYNREMVKVLAAEARKQGYAPDSIVCADDVPRGRPAPWMALRNAQELGVYPLEAIVKVDDTVPGLEAGLNAGMWTVGIAKTGNELGLSQSEVEALEPADLETRLGRAYTRLYQAGAHYVVDGVGDLPGVLDHINRRLAGGEKP